MREYQRTKAEEVFFQSIHVLGARVRLLKSLADLLRGSTAG